MSAVEAPKPVREDLLADVFPGVARSRVEVNGHIFTFPSSESIKIKARLAQRRAIGKYPPETVRACHGASKRLADLMSYAEDHLHRADLELRLNDPREVDRWIAVAREEFEAAEDYWNEIISDDVKQILKV